MLSIRKRSASTSQLVNPLKRLLHPQEARGIALVAFFLFIGSCTTVKHNAVPADVRSFSEPELGVTVTVGVGEEMVKQGTVIEEEVLAIHEAMGGTMYQIPAGQYLLIGFDEEDDFYDASGVTRSGIADPITALALGKSPGSAVRVITVFGASVSYDGQFDRETRLASHRESFQQTLLYSGRIGDRVSIGYREFSNNLARPAFNNDVEYDLSDSNIIGYKGASIEVLEADNSGITYRVIRNFK